MNYAKPEIAVMDAAAVAIQGVKNSPTQFDNVIKHTKLTVMAYEADE